jgi:hypothetical protein
MENFYNYISKQLDPEEVDIWFRVNNIIPEKMELYYDFCHSLYLIITNTYLGEELESKETKVEMNDEDNVKHFLWCWKKNIENFKKESIDFESSGDHFEYFYSFFKEIFYDQKESKIKKSINVFFDDLFNRDKPFTQVDLDLVYNIYKSLDKNLIL